MDELQNNSKPEGQVRDDQPTDLQVDEERKDQYELFRNAYNQICFMMQGGQRNDVVKLDLSHQIQTHTVFRYQGIYFQIASKSMTGPLYMSVSHDDVSALGVQIFWSRRTKYPHRDDCDGAFLASGQVSSFFY